MKVVLFALFIFALSLSAADISGKWSGSYDVTMADGDTMNGKVVMVLTQDGSDLTGTIGSEESQLNKITNGRIDGNEITFESQTEGPLMKFTLRLEDDHIRGVGKGDMEGNAIQVKLDLTRSTN